MSFKDCIGRAVAGGEMDKKRAEQIISEYDRSFEAFRQHMGWTQADAEAARSTLRRVQAEAFEKRRVVQLQAAAVKRQGERMAKHKTMRGADNPGGYLIDVISNKRGSGGQTLDGKFHVVRASFRSQMGEAIQAFRANLVGVRRNVDTLRNVTREIFGEETGDKAAKAIARSWAEVSEKARTRFNAAGGHIGKRADWGLPQHHDARRVRKAGYQAWKAAILPRLDLEVMGRDFNDGLPFTPESLEVLLKDAFEAIRTDGHSRRKPAARAGGSSLANRRADHRFFKFKDAENWMAYSEEFGAGQDAFRVMMGHLDNMAMDIALMEELGPNPNHTFAFLKDAAMSLAQRSPDTKAPDRVRKAQTTATGMFDLLQGRTDIPHNVFWAQVGSAVRNFSTSALLGRAVISSVSDINTARTTASFMGLGQLEPTKMMARIYRSPALRADLNEAGLIFENAVDIGNAVARFELEDMQFQAAARLSDFTIRTTGLGWLTEARKQAFGGAIMHTIASDWRGKAFGDLKPRTQRTLSKYGITRSDWELIRQAKVHTTERGLTLVRPQEVERVAGQAVADRYLEAIHSMQEFAVPSTDLRGRSATLGGTKRGSIPGEFIRFGLQFKGFSITLLMTHVARVVEEAMAGRPGGALALGANLIIGNTLLGGVAIQLKELAKGKDPKDMTTAEFWGASFLQGGGVGIFGDFLFADHNRFGGGLGKTLAGPGVGLIEDVAKLTAGNIADRGDNAGRDMVDFLRRWTPGGSNWYWAAVYQREILDQVQQVVDPRAQRSFNRRAQSAKNLGSSYFYPPGSSAITGEGRIRAPQLKRALGER